MGQEANTVEELKTSEEPNTPEAPGTQQKTKGDEELRRTPRLQCSGLAGIQMLPACEKPCPARIVNLSIGGCLMESERSLGLEIDEIVELIFCVNQMPFRVRGQVRAIRSKTLVGFQFPQLSDRVRRQLEDLVGELIEHLAKLHKESLAKSSNRDDAKPIHNPAALVSRGAVPSRPIKPVEVRPGNGINRVEPARRWF